MPRKRFSKTKPPPLLSRSRCSTARPFLKGAHRATAARVIQAVSRPGARFATHQGQMAGALIPNRFRLCSDGANAFGFDEPHVSSEATDHEVKDIVSHVVMDHAEEHARAIGGDEAEHPYEQIDDAEGLAEHPSPSTKAG